MVPEQTDQTLMLSRDQGALAHMLVQPWPGVREAGTPAKVYLSSELGNVLDLAGSEDRRGNSMWEGQEVGVGVVDGQG